MKRLSEDETAARKRLRTMFVSKESYQHLISTGYVRTESFMKKMFENIAQKDKDWVRTNTTLKERYKAKLLGHAAAVGDGVAAAVNDGESSDCVSVCSDGPDE